MLILLHHYHCSFAEQFVSSKLDGIGLLLDVLKQIQLSQTDCTVDCRLGARQQHACLLRTLSDEHECLTALRLCCSGDAAGSPAATRDASALAAQGQLARRRDGSGLYTLAVCLMSNVNKSRVLAAEVSSTGKPRAGRLVADHAFENPIPIPIPVIFFLFFPRFFSSLTSATLCTVQLLCLACENAKSGHEQVLEAISTLRLRFGEPIRFKFLVGMLNSFGSPDFQVRNVMEYHEKSVTQAGDACIANNDRPDLSRLLHY